MKVKELMRLKPKIVYTDTSLSDIWELLSDSKFHMLPVIDENSYIQGIITAEDLLMTLIPDYQAFFSDFYPEGPSFDDIKEKMDSQMNLYARDIMNKTVYTVYEDHDVFKALSRMLAYDKRILPVINNKEKLAGFIVEKDIFKYLFEIQKNKLSQLLKKQNPQSVINHLKKIAGSIKLAPDKYLKILKK